MLPLPKIVMQPTNKWFNTNSECPKYYMYNSMYMYLETIFSCHLIQIILFMELGHERCDQVHTKYTMLTM